MENVCALRRHGAITWVVFSLLVPCAACGNAAGRGVPSVGPSDIQTQPYSDHLLVTATPRGVADVDAMWRFAEYVLSPHDPGLVAHELVVKEETLVRLRSLGVPLTVASIPVQAMIDEAMIDDSPRKEPRTTFDATGADKLEIFGPFFDRVQQLDALEAYLGELAQASQGRAQVITIGHSVENRPIKAIRVSSAPEGSDRPSVIITGTQHAREWASPMVTIGLADALVRQYGTDLRVKKIVDTLEIFIIPVMNPDGYVASHGGRRLQRKNMNPRCNVDLNRNWGEWWGMGVPGNGCNEETYPGAGAFSEPETQAVRQLAESRKNLRFYMDYHSPANQVMYSPCFERAQSPAQDESRAWTELYARAFTGTNGASIPSRSCFGIGGGQGGCSTDWFHKRLPNTLEVELRSGGSLGGFGLTNDLVRPFVEENWAGWVTVLDKVADKHVSPSSPLPDAGVDAGDSARPDAGATTDGGDTDLPADSVQTSPDGATAPMDAHADVPPPSADLRGAADASSSGPRPTGPEATGGCAVAATERGDHQSLLGLVVVLAFLLRRTKRLTGLNVTRSHFRPPLSVMHKQSCDLRLIAVLSVAVFASACAESEADTESAVAGVLDGTLCKTCQWPTTLSGGGCTVTLVHPRVITTAKHCGTPRTITFGETTNQNVRPALTVQRCYPAPSGDFSFCVLNQEVTDVPIIPLMSKCEADRIMKPGKSITIVGFGRITSTQSSGGRKHWGETVLGQLLGNGNTVVLGDGMVASCYGDSGGPAYTQMPDGTWRLFGTTSGAYGSGGGGCPGRSRYNYVPFHLNWMEMVSGIDLTPCHDSTGKWDPKPGCEAIPTNPGEGVGTWADMCKAITVKQAVDVCSDAIPLPPGDGGAPDAPRDSGRDTGGADAVVDRSANDASTPDTAASADTHGPADTGTAAPRPDSGGPLRPNPGPDAPGLTPTSIDGAGCGCQVGARDPVSTSLGALGLLGLALLPLLRRRPVRG